MERLMYLYNKNEPNCQLIFVRYSKRRYKYEVDRFIKQYSCVENANTDKEETVIFDGITYYDAKRIKDILIPFGCQTKIDICNSPGNEKEELLKNFLSESYGAITCLRCGSSKYAPAHGLLGLHPSRWRCKKCGWVFEF